MVEIDGRLKIVDPDARRAESGRPFGNTFRDDRIVGPRDHREIDLDPRSRSINATRAARIELHRPISAIRISPKFAKRKKSIVPSPSPRLQPRRDEIILNVDNMDQTSREIAISQNLRLHFEIRTAEILFCKNTNIVDSAPDCFVRETSCRLAEVAIITLQTNIIAISYIYLRFYIIYLRFYEFYTREVFKCN